MFRFLYFACLLLAPLAAASQTPSDLAVPLKVSTGINPPAVLISWPNPLPSDVILRRRIKGQAGNTWVELVNYQNTFLDGYFDLGLSGDETYEYALERKTNGVTAYGYAHASFFKPVIDNRGKILVFIDSTTADQLGADLIAFKNDLRGEGWQTVPMKTGPFTTVQQVKNKIQAAYNADPQNVKMVLLMGNVPIPYSGSMAWDNRSDHAGAWPCDAYYGDMSPGWTDNTVNITNTGRTANRNVPGDGKFDQNTLPSAVELPVGRLDFRRLSAATFGLQPVELLRRYLLKNHLYRTGQLQIPYKALVDDHLGWSGGEAFAADGYRNAYPLAGADGVQAGDLLANTNPAKFLLGFGAGTAGAYSGAGGIGNAANVANDTVNVVFASLFGDYFGDWDYETNPLMPAFLAGRGAVLAVQWSGRPHWMLQGLAAGESIGYCLKETQNARFNDAYGHSNAESGAHIALLGDPTLRAQVVAPVGNLTAQSNCNRVSLHWTASPDPEVLGYIVYRAFSQDGPYTRITPGFVTDLFYDDTSPVADTLFYAVRAMKLEIMPGGGAFYNSSTSPIKSAIFVPGTGPTAIGLGGTLSCAHPQLTLATNFQPPTCTWQWFKPNGQPLGGFTATEGGVYTVVVTAPNSCTTAAYATVSMDTLVPAQDFPSSVTLDCAHPTASVTVPGAFPGGVFYFNGVEVAPGTTVNLNSSGVFTVSATGNGCSDDYPVTVLQNFLIPVFHISASGQTIDCNNPSVTLTGNAGGPVQYAWSVNGQNTASVIVTGPGTYCCTVTSANGCTASDCETVTQNNTTFNSAISMNGDPCASGEKVLVAQITGGTQPFSYLWNNGASGPSITVPSGFAGVVALTVTDASGCLSNAVLPLYPAPTLLALTDKASSSTAADGSIDLIVSGGQEPLTYQWSNGGNTQDITGLTSGIYTVTVTAANGCTTVLTVPLITVAAGEPDAGFQVNIRPNPADDRLLVRVSGRPDTEWHVVLIDLAGRKMAEQRQDGTEFLFDTTLLPAGLYVLTINDGIETGSFRVAVNH